VGVEVVVVVVVVVGVGWKLWWWWWWWCNYGGVRNDDRWRPVQCQRWLMSDCMRMAE
jgi:hypothetical protein